MPLYGCDDSPLPSIIDLFVHETKEDLIRSTEQQESEEIISSHTVPNLFGGNVCPSRCTGPDDSQSWFSRTGDDKSKSSLAELDFLTQYQGESITRSHTVGMSFDSLPNMRSFNKSTIPSPLPPPPMKKTMLRRHSNSSRTVASEPQTIVISDHVSTAASLQPRYK